MSTVIAIAVGCLIGAIAQEVADSRFVGFAVAFGASAFFAAVLE